MNDIGFRGFAWEVLLEQMAQATPTPGGGSAAGLGGAAGAALLEMAAGVAAGRKGAPVEELERLRERARQLRDGLVQAVEDDARAYQEVDKALKLPKATEEETARRKEALQDALHTAAKVPLATAERGLEVLKLGEMIRPLCPRVLASDLACAMRLAFACVGGSLDNVDANALSIKDAALRKELGDARDQLEQEAQGTATAVLAELRSTLSARR